MNASSFTKCPECKGISHRIFSTPAVIRVDHSTDKIAYNAPERIEDRQKALSDSSVQKKLKRYAEEQKSQPYSPYHGREI